MIKKYAFVLAIVVLGMALAASYSIAASVTTLNEIRTGQHETFTRLVLDSEGARPVKIGPASAESVSILYETLELGPEPSVMFRRLAGAAAQVIHRRLPEGSVITVRFRQPHTAVKSFTMGGQTGTESTYRLVMDLYPPGSAATGPGALIPSVTTVKTPPPVAEVKPAVPDSNEIAEISAPSPEPGESSAEQDLLTAEESETESEAGETSATEAFLGRLSGELSVIGRLRNDDAKDSLYTQYRDPKAVSGGFDAKYKNEDRYYLKADGRNLSQDDVNLNFRGNRYGKIKGGITYDEIPHRFAFGVKTLYSGVGSDNLTLDDGLQSNLQALAGNSAAQAQLLENEFAKAAVGDPKIERKRLSGDLELLALDPFSLRTEFKHEQQEGTRPFLGSFGLGNALEIFEPIDNETWSVKLIAELAQKSYLLNATYYYQNFHNNEDTLTFDNPFRVDDAVGEPTAGRIDLAPDNHYQNLSLAGSYANLPLNSRISANAAWGWMRQDDELPPFTTNTALVAPIDYMDPANLPVGEADVKVDTALYNATLTARPFEFMHVKSNFRHYDYHNKTDKIEFPNGYVSTDAFAEIPQLGVPISTRPSSYRKTKADVNLGFDVWAKTRLNLDYAYILTKRDNREVDKQTDNVLGGSVDTNPFQWADFRASYQRTDTDIDGYDYNVYLESGQDLQQLPGLRKYLQADVVRNRYQLMTNVYSMEPLVLSGSFTFGKDDFQHSSYGLTDTDYYSFSIDGDYSLTGRLSLNAFYIYEDYKNHQKAQGEFDEDGDGIATVTDWQAKGEDRVDTFGGGLTYGVIPERLDFNLTYSYSRVNGKIGFKIPDGSVPDFDSVDNSTLQTLDTSLKYNIWGGYFVTLGYVWQKFDYDDYDKDGFTYVPTDAAGNFNGALLADSLWQDYDAHILYLKFSYRF